MAAKKKAKAPRCVVIAGPNGAEPKPRNEFARQVERAMKRAAKAARKVAKLHGTPIAVMRDGKVIALKP